MPTTDSFYHYLPLSPEQVTWGTYLTGTGRAFVLPNEEYPPQKHPPLYSYEWSKGRTLPDFQILLIQSGEGEFETKESGRINIASTVIMFLFPDIWHRYRPNPESGWNERWISFNGELVHRFFADHHVTPKNPVFSISEETRSYIEQHYDELLKHIHERPAENRLLYSFFAMGLIAEAVDITHKTSSNPPLIQFNINSNVFGIKFLSDVTFAPEPSSVVLTWFFSGLVFLRRSKHSMYCMT